MVSVDVKHRVYLLTYLACDSALSSVTLLTAGRDHLTAEHVNSRVSTSAGRDSFSRR